MLVKLLHKLWGKELTRRESADSVVMDDCVVVVVIGNCWAVEMFVWKVEGTAVAVTTPLGNTELPTENIDHEI